MSVDKEAEFSQLESDVELRCGQSTAIVSSKGGYIRSFTVGGVDVLYPDGQVEIKGELKRRGGIPVLFPWAGPLKGRPRLPQHGFARDLKWETWGSPQDVGEKGVLLSLTHAGQGKWDWFPYDFHLLLQAEVAEQKFRHLLTVSNRGEEPMPVALGIHPYFNVPERNLAGIKINIEGFHPEKYRLGEVLTYSIQPEVNLQIPKVGLVRMILKEQYLQNQGMLVVWTDDPGYICVEPWTTPVGGFLEEDQAISVLPHKPMKFLTEIEVQPE